MPQGLSLVGLNHKSAPIETRERLALFSGTEIIKRLATLGAAEGAVLSTCNRFEIYCRAEEGRGEEVASRILGWIEEISGTSLSALAYRLSSQDAVRHLFNVASGLDSLVIGESEILGQVKDAYEAAKSAGMTRKYFNVLFQRALYVGKKVRSETGVAVGQTSVASVAVQLAQSIFGDLRESSILILGAGAMAESTARHMISQKISRLAIINRTFEKARALASQFNAEARPWEEMPQFLATADIVIASTSSERPILTRETVQAAVAERKGRSLFILDIALPRNAEDAIHRIEHVYLYRLENLEAVVAENMKKRGVEIEQARSIVAQKTEEFRLWEQSIGTGREASFKHSGELETI
ncbi:MAG: glutamyl-tRNA reductase [Elusimicrobiota bacterium]